MVGKLLEEAVNLNKLQDGFAANSYYECFEDIWDAMSQTLFEEI